MTILFAAGSCEKYSGGGPEKSYIFLALGKIYQKQEARFFHWKRNPPVIFHNIFRKKPLLTRRKNKIEIYYFPGYGREVNIAQRESDKMMKVRGHP